MQPFISLSDQSLLHDSSSQLH